MLVIGTCLGHGVCPATSHMQNLPSRALPKLAEFTTVFSRSACRARWLEGGRGVERGSSTVPNLLGNASY